MGEHKHTPGPWTTGPGSRGIAVVARGWEVPLVATVSAVGHSQDAAIANARLIAAAPDLKDGCNALLGLIQLVCARDDMPTAIREILTTSHRIDEARAALTKAGEA